MKSSNVLLIQKSIPPYREGLFNACPFIDIAVHETNERVSNFQFKILKNTQGIFWVDIRLFIRILSQYSYVVLPGPDFTIINLPLIHIICRLKRVKLYYWTQGQNKSSISTILSLVFWRKSDLCMVYSLNNAERLRLKKVKAFPIGNSIGYDEKHTAVANHKRDSLIFVGRIVENKKLLSLVSWFNTIGHKHFGKLSIVGSGHYESELERYIGTLQESIRQKIFRVCETRGEDLHLLLRSHSHYVTAGKIGLGVVEALHFGLPILYDDSLYHSPEVEVLNINNSMHIDFNNSIQLSIKPLIGAISEDKLPYYTHKLVVERMTRLFCE